MRTLNMIFIYINKISDSSKIKSIHQIKKTFCAS